MKSADIDPPKITKLEKILNAHPGITPLKLLVYSGGEAVRMKTKMVVKVEDSLLQDLEDLLGSNSVKLLM
jgi:hypothetical protein